MRIVFVRHGDPDYANDTLTAKGRVEASLLAENIEYLKLENGDFYLSPLGRARDTGAYVLEKLGKQAETLDWLREFPAVADLNESPEMQQAFPDEKMKDGKFRPRFSWDMVPGYWAKQDAYFDKKDWKDTELARRSDMTQVYDHVTGKLDELLASYGYVREGNHYRVEKENDITITCFCHMGIICVLLAHLWGISPVVLLHCLALAPTSVTEVVTEERQQGIAFFRGTRVGDVSHLRIGNEEPSFMARYCEVYSNFDQRH